MVLSFFVAILISPSLSSCGAIRWEQEEATATAICIVDVSSIISTEAFSNWVQKKIEGYETARERTRRTIRKLEVSVVKVLKGKACPKKLTYEGSISWQWQFQTKNGGAGGVSSGPDCCGAIYNNPNKGERVILYKRNRGWVMRASS